MKERKPRTKEQPEYFKSKQCWYDDNTKWKECGRPWANLCDGNIHKCAHLKYKWFASLSDKDKKYMLEHPNNYNHIESKKYESK